MSQTDAEKLGHAFLLTGLDDCDALCAVWSKQSVGAEQITPKLKTFHWSFFSKQKHF